MLSGEIALKNNHYYYYYNYYALCKILHFFSVLSFKYINFTENEGSYIHFTLISINTKSAFIVALA